MKYKPDLNVVTRFAPSPTGYLHLGGARTALFNWMYARKNSGKFLLRIENTDQTRSDPKAESAIFKGLQWLGLLWDDDVIYQFDRKERHLDIAKLLLQKNFAYKCYSTKNEIAAFKEKALKSGQSTKFISPWRNEQAAYSPSREYVVRLRIPESGKTTIIDRVQGEIVWDNEDLDDLILVRSDGSVTYNLAVVVDDFDSKVTHIIRGDDHLTNAAKQYLIYRALDWDVPNFSHIPLIHGFDGKKLSKRHGAVGLEHYQKQGIIASAMIRYLSQLGWHPGNNDLISIEESIQNFNLGKIVKSPARFDPIKLNDICSKLIRNASNDKIIKEFDVFLKMSGIKTLTQSETNILTFSLPFLKPRIKNFNELYDQASFLMVGKSFKIDTDCLELITKASFSLLRELTNRLNNVIWEREIINETIKLLAKEHQITYKEVAQMVRIAIVGKLSSPGIVDMMLALGKTEIINRFNNLCDKKNDLI